MSNTRARTAQAEAMFEDMLQIADDGSRDRVMVDGKLRVDNEAAARSRLRVDTRRSATRQFSNFGPLNVRFERAMAASFGYGRIALSTSSCTAALVAALHGLGIHGNVVVPSFTFAATALAVTQAGCRPIFCD